VFGQSTEILGIKNGSGPLGKILQGALLAGPLGERRIDLVTMVDDLLAGLNGTPGANKRMAGDVTNLVKGMERTAHDVDEILKNQAFPPPGQVADASLTAKETRKLERGAETIFEQLADTLAQAEHLPKILDTVVRAEIEPLVEEPAPEDLPFRLDVDADVFHFDSEGHLGAITSEQPGGILHSLCLLLDTACQTAPGVGFNSGFAGALNAIALTVRTQATGLAGLTLEPSERAKSNHGPMMSKIERKLEKVDKGVFKIGDAVLEQLPGNVVLDDKTQRKAGQIGGLLRDSFHELGQTRQLMEFVQGATESLR
jgi:hypothetical protein